MRLAESTVIVTGGASGLGAAAARELATAGATVVIADTNAEAGKAMAETVGGLFAHTDVCDEDSVQAAVMTAAGAGRPLRLAVSCAGILRTQALLSPEGHAHRLGLYRRVLDVNLIGTFNLLRLAATAIAATAPLDDGERGTVILTSSVSAAEGQAGQVAYAAAKGGVSGMIVPAARDLSVSGIRVCGIAPGVFDTPLTGLLSEEQQRRLADATPFPRRLGLPAEYGRLVRAIAENAYLNAELIRLDGGLRMPPT